MQTKHQCVLIHIQTKGEVGGPCNRFKPYSNIFLLTFPRRYFLCGPFMLLSPRFLKSQGDIVIASVCPSVMLSPPNPLDGIQPCLVCELLTKMGRATSNFFCSAPWDPGEGSNGQVSFNYNYKVNFKDFQTKLLCVYSQMKDTKHIRRDFYSVTWVMP